MKRFLFALGAFFAFATSAVAQAPPIPPSAPTPVSNYSPNLVPTLPHWFSGGSANKLVYLSGDSTSWNAVVAHNLFVELSAAGLPMAGDTVANFGNNGATITAIQTDAVAYGVTQLQSAYDQIQFSGQPSANDTITLNGTTVTFVSGTPTGNQVQIGGSLTVTLSNLQTFLNASLDPQISQLTYLATASTQWSQNLLEMWYKVPCSAPPVFTVATSSTVMTNAFSQIRLPDLIVFSGGVNDVRTGATTLPVLEGRLNTIISSMRCNAATDIVLRTPFTFLTTDPTSSGLVTYTNPPYTSLAQASQAYSTELYQAYQGVIGRYPNVVLDDEQQRIAGLTGQATSWAMSDIIHPGSNGQVEWATDLIYNIIGNPVPGVLTQPGYVTQQPLAGVPQPGQTDVAVGNTPATCWTFIVACLQDPRYFTYITGGTATLTADNGQVQFGTYDPSAIMFTGDIIETDNTSAFVIPNTGTFTKNTSAISVINNLGGSYPTVSGTHWISVWRPRWGDWDYGYSQTLQTALQDTVTSPYQRKVFLNGGGTNFLQISPIPGDEDIFNLNTLSTDTLNCSNVSPITLGSSITISYSSSHTIQYNTTGSWSGLASRYCWILSTRSRSAELAYPAISGEISGTLVSQGIFHTFGGAGTYKTYTANLGTASSSGAVTVLTKVNGTTAVTWTCAQSATTCTAALNSGFSARYVGTSAFIFRPGDIIEDVVTGAGTAAADFSRTITQ